MKEPKNPEEATTKERIVAFMRRREGEHVTTSEVSTALGLSRNQATSALHNLAKRALPESVRRVGDGVWLYTSPSPLDTRGVEGKFAAVGALSGGKVLLIDEKGQLWEAHKVDAPE